MYTQEKYICYQIKNTCATESSNEGEPLRQNKIWTRYLRTKTCNVIYS